MNLSTIPSADISDKKFFSDDERYADLINGLICQGRPVVRKEDLQDLDTQTCIWNDPAIRTSKSRRHVKLRDLVKKASFGVNFLVIGIENQQTIDYSLPLRCMTYETGEYERQAAIIRHTIRNVGIKQNSGEYLYSFSKESRLHPSIIIVLYYGELPWDGSVDLHGMIDFSGIPEEFHPLIQNYRIHLVDVRHLQNTDVFKTDIRQVFDFIRYSDDKTYLKKLLNTSEYQMLDKDAYEMIATHTSMSTLLEPRMMQTKGGKINMCKAMDIWLAEREAKGISQGLSQGISQGNDETSYKMLMKIIVSRFGKKAGELASPTIRYLTSDERIDLVETAATTDTFAHFQDALRRATTGTPRSPQSPEPHR